MMKGTGAPPPSQARSAPPAAQPQSRPAAGTSATTTASAPSPAQYTPPLISPQNLGIDPLASPNNDPSLGFEWRVVTLGSNQTLGCKVSTADGNGLTVQIEQGHYNKTTRGTGVVDIAAVPVAGVGSAGRLTATDDATGATASYSWEWQTPAVRRELQAVAKAAAQQQAKLAKKAAQKPASGAAAKTAEAEATAAAVAPGKAATAFFGQHAVGRRFAFILDRSGSMDGRRWETCVKELIGSLNQLPEDVEFCVVLFSSDLAEPPGQKGWMQAKRSTVLGVIEWIGSVHPDGGTCPAPAFDRVFSFGGRPDVVFFLTDGELEGFSPADCARIRQTSTTSRFGSAVHSLGRFFSFSGAQPEPDTIINTISLDNAASTKELKKMAADSGGQFVQVSS